MQKIIEDLDLRLKTRTGILSRNLVFPNKTVVHNYYFVAIKYNSHTESALIPVYSFRSTQKNNSRTKPTYSTS